MTLLNGGRAARDMLRLSDFGRKTVSALARGF
jgi:hypothetical protein